MGCGSSISNQVFPEVRDSGQPASALAAAPSRSLAPASVPLRSVPEVRDTEQWVERLLGLPIQNANRLVDPETIYEYLSTPHAETGLLPVRLVRSSWLLDRAEQMRRAHSDPEARALLALPCRQEMPEEAFFSGEEVRSLQPPGTTIPRAAVVSVSYCWASPEHPDADGHALLALADALAQQAEKKSRAEKSRATRKDEDHHQFLYWPDELGIFMDWCSAYQKDADGNRSDSEHKTFQDALDNLDLFYAHACPTTVMLTNLPVAKPYHERGWPTYEYSVSCLVKGTASYVWPSAIDIGRPDSSPLDAAPVNPTDFASDLLKKRFTNGRSDADTVTLLYESTMALAFRGSEALKYSNRKWSEEDMEKFMPLLQLSENVTNLKLNNNTGLRGRGMDALVRTVMGGALPKVKHLSLDENTISAREIEALLGAVERGAMPRLELLDVGWGSLDAEGTGALLRALARKKGPLGRLRSLSLGGGRDFGGAELRRLVGAAAAGELPPIDTLRLTRSGFGAGGLAELGGALARGALPRLDLLGLSECRGLDDAGMQALLEPMAEGSMPKLRRLNVGRTPAGGAGLRSLALALARGAMPNLKELAIPRIEGAYCEEDVAAIRTARAGLKIET